MSPLPTVPRIARLGEAIDDRSAGVSESQPTSHFVVGLTDGVIDGLPEYHVTAWFTLHDHHRMPARHQQRHDGKLHRRVLQHRSEEVTV